MEATKPLPPNIKPSRTNKKHKPPPTKEELEERRERKLEMERQRYIRKRRNVDVLKSIADNAEKDTIEHHKEMVELNRQKDALLKEIADIKTEKERQKQQLLKVIADVKQEKERQKNLLTGTIKTISNQAEGLKGDIADLKGDREMLEQELQTHEHIMACEFMKKLIGDISAKNCPKDKDVNFGNDCVRYVLRTCKELNERERGLIFALFKELRDNRNYFAHNVSIVRIYEIIEFIKFKYPTEGAIVSALYDEYRTENPLLV